MSDGQRLLIERVLEAAFAEATRELRAERDELETVATTEGQKAPNARGRLRRRGQVGGQAVHPLLPEGELSHSLRRQPCAVPSDFSASFYPWPS